MRSSSRQRGASLKVVSNYAIGVDNVDVAAATARKILVCNTPDVLTETTADLTFALILSGARRVVEGVDSRASRRLADLGAAASALAKMSTGQRSEWSVSDVSALPSLGEGRRVSG